MTLEALPNKAQDGELKNPIQLARLLLEKQRLTPELGLEKNAADLAKQLGMSEPRAGEILAQNYLRNRRIAAGADDRDYDFEPVESDREKE
jgi:hypothetical protein